MKQKIYIAALLAGMLALAGCGGGSDAVISQNPSEKEGMEATVLTTDTTALTTALDAANDADPITEALINDVVAALAKLRATIAATTEADTEDAEEAFADGTEDLDDLREKQLATVQGELDKSQGKDAETLAKNLHAALVGTGANNEDLVNSENDAAPGPLQDYSFDGTKVTVDPEAASAPAPFNLAKTTDSVSANSGWTGGHFKGKGDNKDHEARVYWLAETKGEGTKFSALADNMIPEGRKNGSDNKVIEFEDSYSTPSDRIVIAGFTGTSGKLTPPGANTVGTGSAAVHTWSGSYYGVRGTYSCTGEPSACEVSRHADEKRVLEGANWLFTVTPANADMEVADTSNTYSYYGWWINKDSAGYQFDSLFGTTSTGDDLITTTEANGVAGTATYNGGAAGKYAIYSTTPKAAESGDFTADVTLTADFDATVDGTSNLTTISGTIDDFMVGGSKKEGWEVAIEKNAANSNATDNMFTGAAVWTIGESEGAAGGDWQASFQDMDKDGVPKIVVGGFDVANGRAEMEGAFGATK